MKVYANTLITKAFCLKFVLSVGEKNWATVNDFFSWNYLPHSPSEKYKSCVYYLKKKQENIRTKNGEIERGSLKSCVRLW